jgi:PEGA domain
MSRAPSFALLAGLALLASGCIHRSLSVRTEPPGAKVYINEQLKGESPVAYDFEWYGWHRVTIKKDGYERVDDKRLIRAPFYLWIPLDLVMEVLPFPVRDRKEWMYTLTAAETEFEVPTTTEGEQANDPNETVPE